MQFVYFKPNQYIYDFLKEKLKNYDFKELLELNV